MQRIDIINKIGSDYLAGNLEQSGEFSYVQAGIKLSDIPKNAKGQQNFKLDIRFEKTNLSILVETVNTNPSKTDIKNHKDKLLNGYCELETRLRPNNNLILILAHSGGNDKISVWKKKLNEEIEQLSDTKLKPIEEYEKIFLETSVNNEIKIKKSVSELNEILHKNNIEANIRGQFVGTCLLALKSSTFKYKDLTTTVIIAGIRQVITDLLDKNDLNKAKKLVLIDDVVLKNQNVKKLNTESFVQILDFINNNIIPFINSDTAFGQDLLNLFFTTFNKYVGKKDKNQAFTPDHITHFMCKVANINKNTKVLDPTCGSGSFIVQALIQELNECETEKEKNNVKRNNIYGIEIEEKAFGLSTTNMLIHGDGNSNVIFEAQGGCFNLRDWIQGKDIDVVLMNPPYNATPNDVPETIRDKNNKIVYRVHNWNSKAKKAKSEPTKGFCFVNYIADCVGKKSDGSLRQGAKLLCLLPLSCATGSKDVILEQKERILENNTLDAVFTLPAEMFYPGASANACCMVFTLGIPHMETKTLQNGKTIKVPRQSTFFGYFKDDGFIKKKNLGRISKINPKTNRAEWESTEDKWLKLFKGTLVDDTIAVRKDVTAQNEWLAEAYIKTDYSNITNLDFIIQVRKYFSYLVGKGYDFYNKLNNIKTKRTIDDKKLIDTSNWQFFSVDNLFSVKGTKTTPLDTLNEEYKGGKFPYVTTQATNNGVAGYYDYYTETGNVLVADSAVAGFVSYQAENFSASDHTEKLTPKNFILNIYRALFLVTIFNLENYRYSYGRKFNHDNIKNTQIKLPAKLKLNKRREPETNEDGTPIYEPDWDFMEKYIKSLPYSDLI